MSLIYICSPLRGEIEENIKKANEYSRQTAMQGDCPVAPHCLFTQYLDDNKPQERELGIKMGLELLEHCDELLVCGDRISDGMKAEIQKADSIGIPIRSLTMPMEKVKEECGITIAIPKQEKFDSPSFHM